MEEQLTGGGREFIFSVIWAALLLFIGRIVTAALPDYKIIGVIITIILYCILGFFVLTRYAAVYTYTVKNERVRINRSIGHRNKEAEFAVSHIKSVSRTRPDTRARTRTMRTSVFSRKKLWYIVYEKNGADTLLICDLPKKTAEEVVRKIKKQKKEF